STYNTTLISYTTKLLNTILLNQDKKFRPTNPDSSPLNVEIDISVRSMGPISEQDMVPDTYIRNGRKSYLHTLTVPNILFRVRSDGQVHVSQRLTIKTKCLMFLRKFPMDVQACPIEIGSLGYFTNDLIYYWKDVDLDAKMGNMLSQYKILGLFKSEHNLSDYRQTHRRDLLVDDLDLDQKRRMEKMRLFTAGLMGARRETIQVDDLALDEEEDLPWYSFLFRKKAAKQSSMFYRMAVKAAKARRKLKMRDPAKVVNRVDDVSKVIFPSLYVLFNVLYWIAFLYWIPDEVDQIQGITDIKG
ncbi:Neurotransmitter-gated ion-channel ligand binding domain protein, partial [Teladorsagia circumcincta]